LRTTNAPLEFNGTHSPTTMARSQPRPRLYSSDKELPLTIVGRPLPRPNIFLSRDTSDLPVSDKTGAGICRLRHRVSVTHVRLTQGATTIRTENAQLAVYVFVDFRDRDLAGSVADARNGIVSGLVPLRHSGRAAACPARARSPAVAARDRSTWRRNPLRPG
jgi:hypothetical protein